METEKKTFDKENHENKTNSRYSFSEDMALVNYITTGNRYLKSAGIQVWKEAEKLQICPGRSYLSMKERFRKVIVKNLKEYNVEKEVARKISEFLRANRNGISHQRRNALQLLHFGAFMSGFQNLCFKKFKDLDSDVQERVQFVTSYPPDVENTIFY